MLASKTSVRAPAARVAAKPVVAVRPASSRITRAVYVKAAMKAGDSLVDSSEYYRLLKASDGSTVTLASFRGKQPLVLFFYPKAATPGCTKEVCKFRDEYERFVAAGAAVFGISSDAPEVNAQFAKDQRLQYPLLTDAGSILRKTFEIKADLFGVLPGRQTFVFDADGKCLLSFNDQMAPEKHVDEALAALQKVKVMA